MEHSYNSYRTKYIFRYFILLILLGIIYSCGEDTLLCEANNTGSVEFENTRNKGVIQVFFDKERISANGSGDLNIQPGERASSDLLVGSHNIKVRVIISECVNSSCQVSSTLLSDTDEEIFQCQTRSYAY